SCALEVHGETTQLKPTRGPLIQWLETLPPDDVDISGAAQVCLHQQPVQDGGQSVIHSVIGTLHQLQGALQQETRYQHRG
ncbi:MAG: hypothetical protein ACRD8U_18980, partial [Pyrinomonadaceae bacterium]